MALLEKGTGPSPLELRWFGVMLAAFAGIMGGLVLYVSGAQGVAGVIWGIGIGLCALYYALPATRYLIYDVWMALAYPIGWVISHALMAVIFYAVLTPIGLVMRAFGWDGLLRKANRGASSYWKPLDADDETRRYFQQF